MNLNSILIIILSIILLSCSSLSEKEYIQWIEDPSHGLHVTKQENGLVYDLQFQPTTYLWLQSDRSIPYDTLLTNSNNDLQQYKLKITSLDKASDWMKTNYDEATIQRRIYYFSYLFQDDISLIENGVAQPCVLYHFEQSQSTSSSKTFLLGFQSKKKLTENIILSIHSEMISALPIKIKISRQNIPSLKI